MLTQWVTICIKYGWEENIMWFTYVEETNYVVDSMSCEIIILI